MAKEKTINDVVEMLPKDMPFEDRARKYEEDMRPIMEKWGVAPWAGLAQTNEMLAAVPQLKDMWEKKDDAVSDTATA